MSVKCTDDAYGGPQYRGRMHPVPSAEHVRALRVREEELESHLLRCKSAAAERPGPDPSLGRELDDVRSLLATVRRELTWLRQR